MSLEEFDLLEIPVLCCLWVAHVRHRRSNQGADTFGAPINSVIITALAAIAGSLVGALGSAVGTWITARHQDRRDLLGQFSVHRRAGRKPLQGVTRTEARLGSRTGRQFDTTDCE